MMITGYNVVTAKAIAKEIGIINSLNEETALVMEGPEFMRQIGGIVCDYCRAKANCDCVRSTRELSEPANVGKTLRKESIGNKEMFNDIGHRLKVLARSRPMDKYALVLGLKEQDNVVAVTGNGLNDVAALS